MISLASIPERRGYSNLNKTMQVLGVSLVLLLLFALPVFSQLNLGRILGAITDQSGGAVVGATVTVIDVDRGIQRPLIADSAGEYNAPSLLPGTYTVRAEAAGFRVTERQNIAVGVGQEIRVDLSLQPGEQTQTITVTESLPLINSTNAQLGGTLETDAFGAIPLSGRLYTKALELIPGMASRPGGGTPNFSTNGTVIQGQDWMIDGISALNTFDNGGPLVGVNSGVDNLGVLPLDSIQEVNVIEVPRAEYGWKPGAQINVGLKSGTNAFHGTANAIGRDAAMDAANPFQSRALKATDELEQFGGSIGGPIKKDKLFFFGAYEGERFSVGAPVVDQIPTTATLGGDAGNSLPDAIADINSNIAAGTANGATLNSLSLALAGCPSPAALASITNPALIHCAASTGVFGNSQTAAQGGGNEVVSFNNAGQSDNGIVKIDYHVNAHNILNGEYFFTKANSDTPDGIQSYWLDFNSNRVDLLRAVWIWTPNSNWLNEARFGYDRNHNLNAMAECEQPRGSSFTAAPPNYLAQFGFISGAPGNPPYNCGFPQVNISSSATLGAAAGSGEPSGTWDILDSTSYTHGKHVFKFGGEIHRDNFSGTSHVTGITGIVNFGTANINAFSTASGLEDFLTGVPSGGTLLYGNPVVDFAGNRFAAFAQDDYRINSRLIVNVGLRWEWQTAFTEKNNAWGIFDPGAPTGMEQQAGKPLYSSNPRNFAPRAGIAWDISGKNKTVIRVGGSMVYNTVLSLNAYTLYPFGAGLGRIPTGFTLYDANGNKLASPGNITTGSVNILPGQIQWAQNTPVFNTTSSAQVCANGLIPVTVSGVTEFPAPCFISTKSPTYTPSYVSTWQLGVEHAFTNNISATISYVGDHVTDLIFQPDLNQPLPGAANGKCAVTIPPTACPAGTIEQLRRPYYSQFPYLGQIYSMVNRDSSNYNALQASLVERVSHGLTLRVKYVFAHALDVSDGEVGAVMDSRNPRLDYGNNGATAFQDFSIAGTYLIPGRKSPGQVLEGWEVSSTFNAEGIRPVNATDTTDDISGTGELRDRWTLAGRAGDFKPIGALSTVPCFGIAHSRFGNQGCTLGLPAACLTAAGAEQISPVGTGVPTTSAAAVTGAPPTPQNTGTYSLYRLGCYMEGNSVIVPPAQGTYGTMGRNVLDLVPFREWDASVAKSWKIRERLTARFRAEFFNVLNHREYGSPFTNLASPATFGLARGTPNSSNPINGTGGPREIQLGLTLTF